MKKSLTFIAFALLLHTATVYAQPSPSADPTGQVVLPDNTIVSGNIKDNIRKKGEVIVLNGEQKTKYKAGDISSVQIGSLQYISLNYTFYEVIFAGKNLTLLRKANEPAGIQYNGSDAVPINSEGNIDDLFIKKNSDASLQLITKKNIKEVLGSVCSSCAATVDAAKFDAGSVKKAVAGCDGCK
ncbi:MAG: hypothetical protein Q8941_16425 [Bacteroidota bacterium]|nr:hypothetical protein [Bacteroidota bacterium]